MLSLRLHLCARPASRLICTALLDTERGRRGWGELEERHWHVYTTVCETDSEWEAAAQHRGSAQCSVTTEKSGTEAGWEAGSGAKGHLYTYGWLTLLHSRNEYNTVKQHSNKRSMMKTQLGRNSSNLQSNPRISYQWISLHKLYMPKERRTYSKCWRIKTQPKLNNKPIFRRSKDFPKWGLKEFTNRLACKKFLKSLS